jgi:hypothetical protein
MRGRDLFVLVGNRLQARLDLTRSPTLEPTGKYEPQYASYCERHPEWRVKLWTGQPRPPAFMCPYCAEERLRAQEEHRETEEVPHPLNMRDTGYVRELGAEWLARQQAAGIPLPGSEEERRALVRMDELREIELERYADRARTPSAFAMRRRRSRRYWRERF